jgi:hypothetical protein
MRTLAVARKLCSVHALRSDCGETIGLFRGAAAERQAHGASNIE